ncbi:MAG: hypothetical protein ABW026_06785 [Microvirga sp.]
MTVTHDTLAELAALERALTRVPTRAFGNGEAMVEWTDGLRQRLRDLRIALTPEARTAPGPLPVPRPRQALRPGRVRTPSGSVIPFEIRGPRR